MAAMGVKLPRNSARYYGNRRPAWFLFGLCRDLCVSRSGLWVGCVEVGVLALREMENGDAEDRQLDRLGDVQTVPMKAAEKTARRWTLWEGNLAEFIG